MAENRYNQNELPREVPIREHFRPVINAHYSGIARGTIAANNFLLKPALINMVQQNQFGGAATADPHLHLRTFLEITNTVKINSVSDEIIRLRLFLFSLKDHIRSWLQSLPLGSITTWADLVTKFLSKYFPPAKSAKLKIEITNFRQRELEVLYEAWERYKELLRKCPNHGYADWVQIGLFYNGLDGPTRGNVDTAVGGTIFSKTPDEPYELLEQMTINSYQWPSERSGSRKPAGVYAVDPITSLTAQVLALTTQIAAMNKAGQATSEVALVTAEEEPIMEEAQYINNHGFGGYRDNHPPNTYHHGLRNHENFSYANNKNVLNPPPGFNTSNGEGKPSFKDLVGTFVVESGGHLVEKAICDSGASINIMPSSLYEKLGLSKMISTELSVQLADKSVKVPLGIVDDVELKIDKLKVLAEFLVLDMENSQDVHVILGRPLLAAVGAIIDVERGKMTMEGESQLVEIRASKKSYDPP
ncbi:uncharacterized protein [Primulina eburnea]|uniref:uncharacterized protein n=1 Tax=Primulina eburnea TaxID=1245227 RepID=UPI003C6C891E